LQQFIFSEPLTDSPSSCAKIMPTNSSCYAHSREDQPLEEHLKNTADLCRQFAAQFNAGALGELTGKFHDLGKGSRKFQAYLRHANNIEDEFAAFFDSRWRRDHATFGARHLRSNLTEDYFARGQQISVAWFSVKRYIRNIRRDPHQNRNAAKQVYD
jgi:CRISPR-associated endonuclease Cas3-HD